MHESQSPRALFLLAGADSPDMHRPKADPSAEARALLARLVRSSVDRYHESLRDQAEALALSDASRDEATADTALALATCVAIDHEDALLRSICATHPTASDWHVHDAVKRHRASCGVVVDGSLYVAYPDSGGYEMTASGEHPSGLNVMRLAVLDMARVVDLDRKAVAR